MTEPVITIEPDKPLQQALDVMTQRKISALVVVDNNRPLGIVTERSLIQIRAKGDIDYSLPIKQVMSSPPFCVHYDIEYQTAYQLLVLQRIRHLIVTDHGGMLVGIVTETDFLSHLGLEYFMEFKTVRKVMTRNVLTLTPDSSVCTAMKCMNERKISSLVIEEDSYPIGIVTERDLLRLINLHSNLENIPLHKVMSQPVETIYSDISSHKAAKILLEKGMRRLVVTNSSGHCIGIITETDMIKGLNTSYTDHLKKIIEKQANQITEIKHKVEEALILDSMLQSAGEIAISIMDTERYILHHNAAASKLYSQDNENLIGKNASELHEAKGNKDEFENALTIADKEGKYEFIQELKNNNVIYMATTVFCIRENKNSKIGYGLIAIDITDQKSQQASLEEERNFSKKIIDTAPSIICGISPDGTIEFINPAGEQLTGYGAEELLGEKWQNIFYAGKGGRFSQKLIDLFRKNDVRGYEVNLKAKDGDLRDISWSSVKLFDAKGTFFETLILGNDVTGLKNAVKELERKKKESEEGTIALKVMLDQYTKTKESIEEQISTKLKKLVTPYLDILRRTAMDEKQTETINIISAHIDTISCTFSPKAKEILLGLSSRETMIADLVRQGKTTKDISEILNISLRTVETYRNSLRKKLGINKKKVNLRTYLMRNFEK